MTQTDLMTAPALQPGQLIARGVTRQLAALGFASVEELVPTRGLRVDVMALGPKGEIWIVECKSSRADFMSDSKWDGYLEWADRFFWAVTFTQGPDWYAVVTQEDVILIFDRMTGELRQRVAIE